MSQTQQIVTCVAHKRGRFLICSRSNTTFVMAAFPVVLMDIYKHLAKEDLEYYRESREKMFGTSLEDVSLTRIMPIHMSHICMKGPAAAVGYV